MKCQHCLIHEATFHYRSNINGQIAEQHLCADCAGHTEGGLFAHTLANPMEALLGGGLFDVQSFFAPAHRGLGPAPQRISTGNPTPQEENIPPEADDALKQRRALNALRQEMQTAIEAERFERAAEIRDELYRLEQGM